MTRFRSMTDAQVLSLARAVTEVERMIAFHPETPHTSSAQENGVDGESPAGQTSAATVSADQCSSACAAGST
jgi:hypothetical protein